MKVALVRYRYSPHGGAERYLDSLAAGLATMSVEVCLLSSRWEGTAGRDLPFEKITVPPCPAPIRLSLFARSVRAWAEAHPDWLLFSLERVPGAEVYRAGDGCHAEWLLQKRKLRPLSWRMDYLRPLHRSYLRLEKEMFRSEALHAVIANSMRGKREIIRHFGLPEEKISVVYNGVDLARFPLERKEEARCALRSRFGIGETEPVFLFVGSGFSRKGVSCLVRAAKALSERSHSFRVVIVGKGDPGPYLREAGGAGRKLHFTGAVAGADDIFLGADAFVFPTVYEPFSNACLEAMASGLPVITTVVNGASEILKDGDSGFLLEDPADAAMLADRMEKLLSPDLARRMGEKARNAGEAFPLERNLRETLDCLTRAWREKSGR